MLPAVKSGRFEFVNYTPVGPKKNRESEKNRKPFILGRRCSSRLEKPSPEPGEGLNINQKCHSTAGYFFRYMVGWP